MSDNKYMILAEVTADLTTEYIEKHNIQTIEMPYTVGGIEYDGTPNNCLTKEEFFQKLKNGETSKTAQVTPIIAETAFRKILDLGHDVLFITFSSGLTGGYQSVNIAKSEIENEYPNQKIMIIDSLCASLGHGLLVDFACMLKEQGKPIEEVYEATLNQVQHVCLYFTVDDLNHLYRGGRVSKISAIVGTLLGIKPVLHVDEEGRLVPYGKVRGRKASLDAMVNRMEVKMGNQKNDYVFISHGDALSDAEYVAKQIYSKYKIKTKMINMIGPVIGSHSGPGTIALFYMGENRAEKSL